EWKCMEDGKPRIQVPILILEGAEIILGYPGALSMSPEHIPEFTKTVVEECGVQLVDKPEDMIGKVDGIMIESVGGSAHLERAMPFLEAKVPTWIDKPLACSTQDARAIIKLAKKHKTPLFSASTLRYGLEVQKIKAMREELGAPLAVDVYGKHQARAFNPGWLNYGFHTTELLFELIGPGFQKLKFVAAGAVAHASGSWKSGAIGSVTLISEGDCPFGFTYFGEKKTQSVCIDMKYGYRELLKKIVEFFNTGNAPTPIENAFEVIKYLETVNKLGALAVDAKRD
ncbi:MAG: Gfo/Idh/MocA family oxidoreductase, partial [Planctomycetota bacterium]